MASVNLNTPRNPAVCQNSFLTSNTTLETGATARNRDGHIRQWHAAVKKALGIEKPTAVSKETLTGK